MILAQKQAAADAATQHAQQLRAQLAKETEQAALREEQASAEAAADAAAEAAAFHRRRALLEQQLQQQERRELQKWAFARNQNNKRSAIKAGHDHSSSTDSHKSISRSGHSSSATTAATSTAHLQKSNTIALKERQAEIASAEAKAETLRNAVRRPPDIITDRPYLKAAKPGSTKQASLARGAVYTKQQTPLAFFSEAKPNRGFRGGGGYGGARFAKSYAFEEGSVEARAAAEFRDQETVSVSRDSQRRFGPTTTRCAQGLDGSISSHSSSNLGAHGIALGHPSDTFAFAALYRDFGSWWSLAAPRRVEGCSYGVGGRLVVLQLNWRAVWWRDLSLDFTPHWQPRSSFLSTVTSKGEASFRGNRGNNGLRGPGIERFERQPGSGPLHEAQMQRDDDWGSGSGSFGDSSSGRVGNGNHYRAAFGRSLLENKAKSMVSTQSAANKVSALTFLRPGMVGNLPHELKAGAQRLLRQTRRRIGITISKVDNPGKSFYRRRGGFVNRRSLAAPSHAKAPSSDITGLTEARFGKFTWAQWLKEVYGDVPAKSMNAKSLSTQVANGSTAPAAEIEAEAARHWWANTVPAASKASPPKAGKQTLVFLHVPKTVPIIFSFPCF